MKQRRIEPHTSPTRNNNILRHHLPISLLNEDSDKYHTKNAKGDTAGNNTIRKVEKEESTMITEDESSFGSSLQSQRSDNEVPSFLSYDKVVHSQKI